MQDVKSIDLISLEKFWHWADNERPARELFDQKATAGGPLTEEAQEAMQQAVEVVSLRAPDCLHPSGEVLRPAIKVLSLAILQAWERLKDNPMIVEALEEQKAQEDNEHDQRVASFDVFCGGNVILTYSDGTQRHGTVIKDDNGVYEFKDHPKQAGKHTVERVLGNSYPDHSDDLSGYTAYNRNIPTPLMGDITQSRQLVPVIGEMGVTRSIEDSFFEKRMKKLIQMETRRVNVRVDSRGIWISSKEFPDIGMLCQASEFETCSGNGSIDTHKLRLLINTLRLNVNDRKKAQCVDPSLRLPFKS